MNKEFPKKIADNVTMHSADPILYVVSDFLNTPSRIEEQVKRTQEILDTFKTDKMSSQLASLSLNKFLQ